MLCKSLMAGMGLFFITRSYSFYASLLFFFFSLLWQRFRYVEARTVRSRQDCFNRTRCCSRGLSCLCLHPPRIFPSRLLLVENNCLRVRRRGKEDGVFVDHICVGVRWEAGRKVSGGAYSYLRSEQSLTSKGMIPAKRRKKPRP